MATLFLLDLTLPKTKELEGMSGLPPLSWWTAAELGNQSTPESTTEAFRELVTTSTSGNNWDSAGSAEENDLYTLVHFPERLRTQNKYFTTALTAVVGFFSTRPASAAEAQSAVGAHLSTAVLSTLPFACVFTAWVSDRPDWGLPWHALPSRALFNVVLLFEDGGDLAEWRQLCQEYELELILHRSPYGDRPTSDLTKINEWKAELELIPPNVAALQLRAAAAAHSRNGGSGGVAGSTRLAQLLANTLWPQLEQPAQLQEKKILSECQVNNVLVVGDQPGQLRRWCVMNHENPVEERFGVFAEEELRGPGTRMAAKTTETATASSIFPACNLFSLPSSSFSPNSSHSSSGAMSSLIRPDEEGVLFVVNRYFVAAARPVVVHPIAFDSTRDDERRHSFAKVFSNTSSSSLFSLQPRICFIFWPPLEPTVSLREVFTGLSEFQLKEEVAVVVAATAGLTSHEQQVCAAHHAEVVQLNELDLTNGTSHLPRRISPHERNEMGREDKEQEQEQAKEEEKAKAAGGRTGVSRLCELLHLAEDWRYTTPIPPSPSFSASKRENICVIYCCAHRTATAESYTRELLSAVLPTPLLISGDEFAALPPVCSAFPSLVSAFLPRGLLFRIQNRYFTAQVRLWCFTNLSTESLQWRLGKRSSEMWNGVQAFVFACTRAGLKQAAQAKGLEDVKGPFAAFARALQAAQTILAKVWRQETSHWLDRWRDTEGEAERQYINKSIKELEQLPNGPTTATTAARMSSCVGLLYVLDADLHEEGVEDEIHEHLMQVVLSSDPTEVDFPLLEVVGKENSLRANGDWQGCTEGLSRIREALSQNPWRYTTSQEGSKSSTTKEEKNKITPTTPTTTSPTTLLRAGETEAAPPITTTRANAKSTTTTTTIDTTTNHTAEGEPVKADVEKPRIGCVPPPHFLMDPELLRTVAVPALQYFQAKSNTKLSDPAERPSVDRKDKEAEAAYSKELMEWSRRMKLHGDRLPREVRMSQAEVLTLALGEALL